MSSTLELEYDYGTAPRHLDDSEMLDVYQKQQEQHPGAIISLEAHECGHWTVDTYASDPEKQIFYAKRLANLWANLFKRLATK